MIYFRDEDGGTPLYYAAFIGYVEGVSIFLESSTQNAIEPNKKGYLPIHLAGKMGHLEEVKVILQQETVNPIVLINQQGQNILHIAGKVVENTVVKYLLRSVKVDSGTINGRDVNGDTPLQEFLD